MNDNFTEVQEGTIGNKKDFTYSEIQELIRKMNLNYSNHEMKEIVQEVGINEKQTIKLDDLIEKSKNRRSFSKYSEFYDCVLNLFITPSERIVKILHEVKEKLQNYKEARLVTDLEWVIKKIHNDDIYNLNFDAINDFTQGADISPKNSEMESVIKFFAEYSSDAFTKSKKEDLKTVKDLSNKRMNQERNSGYARSKMDRKSQMHNLGGQQFNRYRSISNFYHSHSGGHPALQSYSSTPDVSKNKDSIKSHSIFKTPLNLTNENYSSENWVLSKPSINPENSQPTLEQVDKTGDPSHMHNNMYYSVPTFTRPISIYNDNFNLTSEEGMAVHKENKKTHAENVTNFNNTSPHYFPTPDNEILSIPSEDENTENNKDEHNLNPEENNSQTSRTSTSLQQEDESKDEMLDSPNQISNTNLNKLKKINNFKRSSKLGRVSLNYVSSHGGSCIESWNTIDELEFDLFDYCKSFGRENIMVNVSDYIFDKYELYSVINNKRFETFLDKIRVGYDYLLPYHNDLHATDVLQTCHIFTTFADLKNSVDLTSLDLAAFFISCIIHDFKHPGLNNNFQINKKTHAATKYNDISVLENYHVSSAFKVITHPNSNIFCDLSIEEYRVVRKRIVECVLSTDMAKHTKSITSLKIRLDGLKKDDNLLHDFIHLANEETKFDRQQEILNFLIHMADISNPGKKFEICKIWCDLVMEEFFLQGDLEKQEKLPVSFLCDRSTTNIPKSQIMFISNIVLPSFKILSQLIPKCGVFVKNMYDNIEKWNEEEEKQRK